MNTNETKKMLKYAMVGGGPGAFIGDVHRTAIRIDNKAMLVGGVFSADSAKSKAFGIELGLDEKRLYDSALQMATEEGQREDGIDFVVIVTPNVFHYSDAKAFLENGIHVVSDKPLTVEVEQSRSLVALAQEKGLLFGVTYTYTGYPVVKQIAHMIQSKAIGEVRFVNAEYPQQWLVAAGDVSQIWRAKPEFSGKVNCLGDIGTHVENMVATMTGLSIKRLCARLDSFVENHQLDDNVSVMVEYEGGAKGLYWTSQIAIGYDNALKVRIFGTQGTIEWSQEEPDQFSLVTLSGPKQIYVRGRDTFAPVAQSYSRLPGGHPEGVYEAFANIYKAFTSSLLEVKNGVPFDQVTGGYPTVEEGLRGIEFVDACLRSSQNDMTWVDL